MRGCFAHVCRNNGNGARVAEAKSGVDAPISYTGRVPRPVRFVALLIFSTLALSALTGCGVVGGASATKTPTETETPTVTVTPTPSATPTASATPTPEPTSTPTSSVANVPYTTATIQVAQARTTVVRASLGSASGAILTFRGQQYPMLREGGDVWLPIGASADTAVGNYPLSVTFTDANGSALDTKNATVQVTPTDFPVERVDVPPSQDELLSPEEVQKELNIRAALFAKITPEKLWNGPFIIPVTGAISSPFGIGRSYNGAPVTSHHSGTDLAVPEGTPIMASAHGRVVFAGALTTRGNSVVIDHGLGVFTDYSHMSRIDVSVGQEIAQGQIIGAVGMTGLATGPHLHWELIVSGANVDPTYWTYAGVAP